MEAYANKLLPRLLEWKWRTQLHLGQNDSHSCSVDVKKQKQKKLQRLALKLKDSFFNVNMLGVYIFFTYSFQLS